MPRARTQQSFGMSRDLDFAGGVLHLPISGCTGFGVDAGDLEVSCMEFD